MTSRFKFISLIVSLVNVIPAGAAFCGRVAAVGMGDRTPNSCVSLPIAL
jgi:hypothetical protein